MSRWQIIGIIAGVATPMLTVVVTIIGATWMLLGEISEVRESVSVLRGEVRESISALRGEVRESISALRGEIRESVSTLRGEARESASVLRGDITNVSTKFDEFTDSHEREHDLFYGTKDDKGGLPSAN